MSFEIRWTGVIVAGFFALVGRSETATAQSKEELIERYKPQCMAQNMHLKAQGYEAVRAAVVQCVTARVQAHMRGAVVGELKPLWDRVNKLIDAGNLNEAEAAAKHAIARAAELAKPDGAAVAAGHALLGKVQLYQGRFREGEQSARKALPAYERELGTKSPNTAKVYTLLAYNVMSQGRQSEAETYCNRALEIQERDPGPSHPDTAVTLMTFALLRLEQGRLTEAEPLARRAVAISEKALGPKSGQAARALSLLGVIQRYDSRYAEAEATLKQALTMWDAAFSGQHFETAVTLSRLADVYIETGRYAEAEPLLDRSLETLQKSLGPDHRYTFMALRHLGTLKIKTGDFHQGELTLRRAIASAEKAVGSRHVELVYMYGSLGEALQKQKQYKEAEVALNSGLAVAERIGKESPFVCGMLASLGPLYADEDRLDEARAALRRAFAVCTQSLGPTHIRTINTLRKLAELSLLNKEPAEALVQLKQAAAAIEARRETGALIGGHRFNDEVAPLLRAMATDFAQAAWQLELADGQAKGKFADDALFGSQLLTQSTAATAIAQMGARVAANDDALGRLVRQGQDLQQRWDAIDRQLTVGFEDGSGDADSRGQLRTELDRAEKELSEVGRRIAAGFPEYAAFARPASLRIEEIQKLIGADEVLVTFLIEGTQSYAWVVGRTATRWTKLELPPRAIAEKVAQLRCGLDAAGWEDDASVCTGLLKGAYRAEDASAGKPLPFDLARAHELYRALFGEVEDLIEGKHLLIVPSGALTSLPFQVLVAEPPGSAVPANAAEYASVAWLAKHNAVTSLPSISSLKALRQVAKASKASQPFLGFGNPLLTGPAGSDKSAWTRRSCADPPQGATEVASRGVRAAAPAFFRAGLADVALVRQQWPLPETADELCAVAQSIGASLDAVYLGAKATETVIKALSADGTLGKARIVHFATHGLLAGESGALFAAKAEPALVLSPPEKPTATDDGLLTASEVAQLGLDAEWVVLSACNTASAGSGNTAGETLSGLARAFFYAGARALLVSHWAVDSQATVELIVATFGTLKAEPNAGRAEALRRSMLTLIASGGRFAHPATWAPFVVVGEGTR